MKNEPGNQTKQESVSAQLEHIPCNLCGLNETELLYTIQSMHIVKCKSCGLIYVNPRLADPNPDNIYDEKYFEYYLLTSSANKITYDRRLKLIEKYYPQKGRILDVGCSIGDFMEVALRRGWQPHGIDISDAHQTSIRERIGLSIDVGDFVTIDLAPESFDVVNMGDSIEHMLNPIGAIKRVYEVLKPDGVGYIRAPDILAFSPRLTGKKWIQLKPREHFYYFSRQTIRAMLEKCGFRVLKISTSGTYCNLNILKNRLDHYYGKNAITWFFHLLADKMRLGEIPFYLDVFEEFQVLFKKR